MRELKVVVLLVLIVGLAACGGGSDSSSTGPGANPRASLYNLSGSVSGLTGAGLVLRSAAGESLNISADGPFKFSTAVADGSQFKVTIAKNPSNPTQSCKVDNGAGTVAGKDITNVSVTCVTNTYAVRGTVTGLLGSGLVLRNNGGDDLAVSADGTFLFATAVTDGTAYDVTIATQPSPPPNQTCSVSNGSGTLKGRDISNVTVNCVSQPYTISVNVTGLNGSGLVLLNNGIDNLNIAADGLFAFSKTIADGTAYGVSILTQPSSPNQTCTISSGSGNVNGADITVAVSCSDNIPVTSISDASVVEGDSGTANLIFTVNLSVVAAMSDVTGNVTVDYAASDGTATAGSDYTATSGTLTIPAGTTSNTIAVPVAGDTGSEPNETLTLTLSNISANATLGTAVATGTLINDDGGFLDDTGITLCANGGASPCATGQEDGDFGRDVTANDDTDGHAGFSFVKLDNAGGALTDQSVAYTATPWNCILDQVTKLMWEVKTDDGGLHDKDWTYTWYNSDGASNGGDAGTAGGTTTCGGTVIDGCDTEKFLSKVNNAGLCGYTDWRVPTADELLSLVDYSPVVSGPVIDGPWFPNTIASAYWSSKRDVSKSGNAWYVNFGSGTANSYLTSYPNYYVRLVRGGQ